MSSVESRIGGNLEEIRALLNIEQPRNEANVEEDTKKIIVENDKDYTMEELAGILASMYNAPTASNKATAVHMFGIKYGKNIRKGNYTSSGIVTAAKLNPSYHAELTKGINIYESILANEYGVAFYNEDDNLVKQEMGVKVLPDRDVRVRKLHPLNSILYGAPGTGKTYATAQYALSIAENKLLGTIKQEARADVMIRYNQLVKDGRIVFTTFHQNYGYEDFIQGIRPDTSAKEMTFKTVDGVFKVIAEKAMKNPDEDYIIILDEINRANISKVFGELITLIEDDKRWGEVNAVSVTLPSGEVFAVPNNLYIIGTMNSADKSISLIDTALRRRFEFVEFVPDLSLVSDSTLKMVLGKLNDGIAKELNSTDLLVGHSYFMNRTADDVCEIMNRNIIPLLYEYFFDNQKKVEAQIKKATEGLNVEIQSSTMGRIKIVKRNEA